MYRLDSTVLVQHSDPWQLSVVMQSTARVARSMKRGPGTRWLRPRLVGVVVLLLLLGCGEEPDQARPLLAEAGGASGSSIGGEDSTETGSLAGESWTDRSAYVGTWSLRHEDLEGYLDADLLALVRLDPRGQFTARFQMLRPAPPLAGELEIVPGSAPGSERGADAGAVDLDSRSSQTRPAGGEVRPVRGRRLSEPARRARLDAVLDWNRREIERQEDLLGLTLEVSGRWSVEGVDGSVAPTGRRGASVDPSDASPGPEAGVAQLVFVREGSAAEEPPLRLAVVRPTTDAGRAGLELLLAGGPIVGPSRSLSTWIRR